MVAAAEEAYDDLLMDVAAADAADYVDDGRRQR